MELEAKLERVCELVTAAGYPARSEHFNAMFTVDLDRGAVLMCGFANSDLGGDLYASREKFADGALAGEGISTGVTAEAEPEVMALALLRALRTLPAAELAETEERRQAAAAIAAAMGELAQRARALSVAWAANPEAYDSAWSAAYELPEFARSAGAAVSMSFDEWWHELDNCRQLIESHLDEL